MEKQITMQQAIARITSGGNLTREEARDVMAMIMDGEATPAQIGAIMVALRMKGETKEEISGFAETMRSKARSAAFAHQELFDTVGTGGDGANTFNISTTSSIVAAAGGILVAKHGNRAISSRSGSADVLEALGVPITLTGQQAAECIDRVGICFLFAPLYHQSMKHAAGPRKEIGIRTVFNLLGPLTNPALAQKQLVGIYDRSKTELVAQVLGSLGLRRAMVVASLDGLDEISISAPTQVSEFKDGSVITYQITAEQLGLRSHPLQEVIGGDAQTNAQIIRSVLNGEQGARRDIVLANAGACFYVTGHCTTLPEGVQMAAHLIDSGRAKAKLQELIEYTGELNHVS